MMKDAMAAMHARLPKMNPIICEGLAYHQSKSNGIEQTVAGYLKSAFRREGEYNGEGLPDSFQYTHMTTTTPLEEFRLRTDRIKNVYARRSGYDLATTYTYVVKAHFENNGDNFERPIAIPYALLGNITYIRGTKYGISNVMKTRGPSRTPKGYFVEFPRHKVQFESLIYNYDIDGKTEHVLIPTAVNLHAKTVKRAFRPVVVGWLLAKYGVTEMFSRFAGVDVKVIASDDPALADLDQSKYVICRAPIPRRGLHCQIVLVVPRDALTPAVKVLIGGVLYIASVDSAHVTVEEADKLERWQIMLGFMIYGAGGNRSVIHTLEEMQTHLTSIERFMDAKFKRELFTVNIPSEDIYEFLYYIVEAMTKKSATESKDIADLSGRFLSPVEYMLRDLREAVFDTMYSITRQARKDRGRAIPTKQIKYVIDSGIPIDRVTKMNVSHGEVAAFMSASDNYYLAQTANCIDQTEARKMPGRSGGTSSLTDPSKHIHWSFITIGSCCWLPKSSPYGSSRINPYVTIDAEGRVLMNPAHAEDMRKVQADLDMKGI